MTKPNITRTYGQIHFEDLDPKRFEDLVRQLIYDFKNWQTIEATGRGGADDGFDIRAYEKVYQEVEQDEPQEDQQELHTMNGNLWMVQCKREQDIGPIRVKKIINENINPSDPPYGYILAVSANISKKTYDAFRSELQKLGVMEFYLWGKATLEDMLYLPKNDRILFTFFGISLVTKRRTKATEIRTAITVKNKLAGILGNGGINAPILIRDLQDESYPYKDAYADFDALPRWKTYTAIEQHPLGVVFSIEECYAYVDSIKMEYDYTAYYNLADQEPVDEDEFQAHWQKRDDVLDFYNTLPRNRQCYFHSYALVKYRDMALVDIKGDSWNEKPHIFIDYIKGSPFTKLHITIKKADVDIDLKGYKRIKIFPDEFKKRPYGKRYLDTPVIIDPDTFARFEKDWDMTIYFKDDRMDYLQQKDIIKLMGQTDNLNVFGLAMVNCSYSMVFKSYIDENQTDPKIGEKIRLQLGRVPKQNDIIHIFELQRIHSWELDQEDHNE